MSSEMSLFDSNYGPILYRFLYIAIYWSKIAKFIHFACIQRPLRDDPVGISQKSLVIGNQSDWATIC